MIYGTAGKSIVGQIRQTYNDVFRDGEPATAAAACNHDKILVIDDEISMTGGRNIAHHYFAPFADSPDVFRDTDALFFSKSVADDLRKGFAREFTSPGKQKGKERRLGL